MRISKKDVTNVVLIIILCVVLVTMAAVIMTDYTATRTPVTYSSLICDDPIHGNNGECPSDRANRLAKEEAKRSRQIIMFAGSIIALGTITGIYSMNRKKDTKKNHSRAIRER